MALVTVLEATGPRSSFGRRPDLKTTHKESHSLPVISNQSRAAWVQCAGACQTAVHCGLQQQQLPHPTSRFITQGVKEAYSGERFNQMVPTAGKDIIPESETGSGFPGQRGTGVGGCEGCRDSRQSSGASRPAHHHSSVTVPAMKRAKRVLGGV